MDVSKGELQSSELDIKLKEVGEKAAAVLLWRGFSQGDLDSLGQMDAALRRIKAMFSFASLSKAGEAFCGEFGKHSSKGGGVDAALDRATMQLVRWTDRGDPCK